MTVTDSSFRSYAVILIKYRILAEEQMKHFLSFVILTFPGKLNCHLIKVRVQ